MDRNLQIIGLAKKAGLLAVGMEDTISAARYGKAQIILSASDASANSLRRAKNAAEAGGVLQIEVPYSSFELGNVSGRGSPGTVSFLDAGLAALFLKGMSEKDPERYSGTAETLSGKARMKAQKKRATQSVKKRRTLQ